VRRSLCQPWPAILPDAAFKAWMMTCRSACSKVDVAEAAERLSSARPIGVYQLLHRLLRNGLNALLHFTRVTQNKIVHQQRNILAPVAKRKDLNRKNIQPVKKVFAELIVSYHALQIAMRCGNQANVHANGLRTPQSFKLVFLQSAQQFRLQLEADVANFI
jgi:hypothetical protein